MLMPTCVLTMPSAAPRSFAPSERLATFIYLTLHNAWLTQPSASSCCLTMVCPCSLADDPWQGWPRHMPLYPEEREAALQREDAASRLCRLVVNHSTFAEPLQVGRTLHSFSPLFVSCNSAIRLSLLYDSRLPGSLLSQPLGTLVISRLGDFFPRYCGAPADHMTHVLCSCTWAMRSTCK